MLLHDLSDQAISANFPVIQVATVTPLKFTEQLFVERGVWIADRTAAVAAADAATATVTSAATTETI